MRWFDRLLRPVERVLHTQGPRLGKLVVVLVLLFLWLPIAVLVFMSFAKGGVLSFPPKELTLQWYYAFLENDAALDAIATTLRVSVVATAITVSLSTLIAYAVDRFEFPGKGVLQLLASLPIVVPLVVTAIAMVLFFGYVDFPSGYWSVLFAHVIRTIPFASLVIIPTFLTFDRRLEEAAMDLGADEVRTFTQITLPNLLPGIMAGGMLAFTMSFNEFVFTYFVKGTGMETLPIYIWNQIRYNVTPEVNVISVFFLLVAISALLFAVSLTRIRFLALR